MTQHGRVRMLSMSVVIIGVAVAVGAAGLLISRQNLIDQIHTQGVAIQSLSAQVRALGAVPITEQPKPDAPTTTTTTAPRVIRSSPPAPVAPAGRSTTTTTNAPSPPPTAPPASPQPTSTTTSTTQPPPCQTSVLGRCVVP